MARHVPMQRPGYAGAKNAYSGFSWTTFFFGFFPALFRGDGMGLLFGIGVWIASAITWAFFLGWIPWPIWAAVYNRNHFERLRSDGWYPAHYTSPYSLPPAAVAPISAPPGWYADPLDASRLRWWTGTSCGETRPAPSARRLGPGSREPMLLEARPSTPLIRPRLGYDLGYGPSADPPVLRSAGRAPDRPADRNTRDSRV